MNVANDEAYSDWGRWFRRFLASSDEVLKTNDLVAVNLHCSFGLNQNVDSQFQECLALVDEWSGQLLDFIAWSRQNFDNQLSAFDGREDVFAAYSMVDFVQRGLRVQYNLRFSEGEYDARDSRNLFLSGILTGFGGTCATLPILYQAMGERVGFPVGVASTWEHLYCTWRDGHPDGFCFEVAGSGWNLRTHDYYRNFRREVTETNRIQHGFLRQMTRRELFADFALERSVCLKDTLRFDEALEAIALASQLAPHIRHLEESWGLCHYVRQLHRILGEPTGHEALRRIRQFEGDSFAGLSGPDNGTFRRHAIKDLRRIHTNRIQMEQNEIHSEVILDLCNEHSSY